MFNKTTNLIAIGVFNDEREDFDSPIHAARDMQRLALRSAYVVLTTYPNLGSRETVEAMDMLLAWAGVEKGSKPEYDGCYRTKADEWAHLTQYHADTRHLPVDIKRLGVVEDADMTEEEYLDLMDDGR